MKHISPTNTMSWESLLPHSIGLVSCSYLLFFASIQHFPHFLLSIFIIWSIYKSKDCIATTPSCSISFLFLSFLANWLPCPPSFLYLHTFGIVHVKLNSHMRNIVKKMLFENYFLIFCRVKIYLRIEIFLICFLYF